MPGNRLSPAGIVSFLGRLRPRVRPHRASWALAAVLLLMSTAVGLAFPLIVRELLDAAFLAGSGELLDRIALGLLFLFAFQAILGFWQSWLTASVSERVTADLRRDVFDRLVRQPPGYFSFRSAGDLSSRIASDASLLQELLRFGLPELLRQGVFLLGALALVTATNPRLSLVTLTAFPLAAAVAWWFGRRVRLITTGIQDQVAAAVARAEQAFVQIRTVQAFRRERWESGRFAAEVGAAMDQGLRRAVARAVLVGAATFAGFGSIVLVLWLGGRLVLAGELTPGTLVAFLLYAVTISGAIGSLAGFYGNLNEAAGAARRIFEILDEPVSLADPPDPAPLPAPLRGVVRFEDVHFRYAPELPPVLAGIDMEVGVGETVALVGSSGAGKSTLASLLPRFFDVGAGRVTIDGVDVRTLRLAELRGAIGIVPQEPMLFAGSIRENLLYGNPDATQAELEEAAEAAHAAGFISELPSGYGQLVGERGVTLSAGQRQRIAIARVMLARPRILILDEASSSLDAESERMVQDALERLMTDRTCLVIAHRLSTVIRADRIMVLDGGRIVDTGTHAALLARSEVYRRLYQRQFEDALATTAASRAPD